LGKKNLYPGGGVFKQLYPQGLGSVARSAPSKSDQASTLFGIWNFCIKTKFALRDHQSPEKIERKSKMT